MGGCVALHQPSGPLISHMNKSTVQLVKEYLPGEYDTFCTAFWISETHLVTASHCVADESDNIKLNSLVNFSTYDEFNPIWGEGSKKAYVAKVVAFKIEADLAVLQSLDNITHDIYKIRKTDIPVGTDVHIVGHPVDFHYSYIPGVVSQIRIFNIPELNKKMKTLHVTSLITNGNSGSAAVDDNGEVVGVSSFMWRRAVGASFFIHKDELTQLLNSANIKYY